jgi:hypothetical protein
VTTRKVILLRDLLRTKITKKQKQRKRPKTVNHNEIQNCLRKKEKNRIKNSKK